MAIELWSIPPLQQRRHYWGIVLAGGEGKRLREFLKSEYRQESPKQFCAIVGRRSMLKHTLDRAASLIPEHHVLTVISRQHLLHAIEDICHRDPKTIVTVPFNRETAPSILLALMQIRRTNRDAVVAIFPSDHFIIEEDRFMNYVAQAFELVASHPHKIVSLGVTPNGTQSGYGWIEKGNLFATKGEASFYHVQRFQEKPSDETMRNLLAQHCVWNTMTMVGKIEMFLRVFKECLPELTTAFQRIACALGTPFETEVTFDVFEKLRSVNFSHSVLESIPQYLAVLPMHSVYWNDWGEEQRIRSDLARFARHAQTEPPAPELLELKAKDYSIELSFRERRTETADAV